MKTIEKMFISAEKGAPPTTMLNAKLIADWGIAGDRFAGKGIRQICLLDTDVHDSIAGLDGLCTVKFVGNFITTGLDYSTIKIGQRYLVSDAEIEIVDIGKPCYPECKLIIANTPCELRRGCAFAKVVKNGNVNPGSEIKLIN